jgi:hypothetical protein
MFDSSVICPEHIKDMIYDLQSQEYGDLILSKYHCKTISDARLTKIYSYLNFPFSSQIPSKSIQSLLESEYLQDFHELDNFSLNYSQSYFDSQVSLFSTPADLNLASSDLFEVASLTSLWSDYTKASPSKPRTPVPKTTVRSKNGLKMLSWKVKEIVEKLGSSTYQEIADQLVKETEDSEGEARDEKNIRRRVYDALNVLISVGVLEKENKKVQVVRKVPNPAVEKIKKLKELTEKYLALKALIARNKICKRSEKALFLPFSVVVVGKKGDSGVNVSFVLQKNSASLKVSHEFFIQSSDEVLKKLEIPSNFDYFPLELSSIFNLEGLLELFDPSDFNK